jgi:DNA-binding transcriptional LysR family regulator
MKQNFTVRQGALDGVEAFLSVAQHRNFRKAAAELGVTPSAMSQAVRTLEARVGAALFIRTTRSVGLTEAGEQFLSRAKPAFEELVAAGEAARALGQRPAGLLRLSVPRAVVPLILEPVIGTFCQAPWPFIDGNKAVEAIVSGPLIAHDYPTLLGAAIQGVGLAQVPKPLAEALIADGRLKALLTPFAVTTPGVFLYYPGRRQVLPKLRAFIEHVKGHSGATKLKATA